MRGWAQFMMHWKKQTCITTQARSAPSAYILLYRWVKACRVLQVKKDSVTSILYVFMFSFYPLDPLFNRCTIFFISIQFGRVNWIVRQKNASGESHRIPGESNKTGDSHMTPGSHTRPLRSQTWPWGVAHDPRGFARDLPGSRTWLRYTRTESWRKMALHSSFHLLYGQRWGSRLQFTTQRWSTKCY